VQELRGLLQDRKGEGTLTLPVLVLITAMVLYMGVDIIGIYSIGQKLRTAASETLTLMKIENGWDNNSRDFFNSLLSRAGLNPGSVTIDFATPKNRTPPVQRGETVTLEVTAVYEVRSLKPLNRTIIVPVKVKLSGLAQEFVRQ